MDLPESFHDQANTLIDAFLIAHIHLHGHRAFSSQIVTWRSRTESDACTLLVELPCYCETDATARAGYNGNLVYGHRRGGSINHGFRKARRKDGCDRSGKEKREHDNSLTIQTQRGRGDD